MTNPSQNFWDFSLWLYKLPKIEQSCLYLQDNHHLDVNVILFCLWQGQARKLIPTVSFEEILGFSNQWQDEVLKPLRDLRNELKEQIQLDQIPKNKATDLREQVKALELRAEKQEQEFLENLGFREQEQGAAESTDSAISTNLNRYLDVVGCEKSQRMREALSFIENACR